MATHNQFLYSLLLLLPLLITFANAQPLEAVLDINGNPIRSGIEYYISNAFRAISPPASTLALAPNRNNSCPFDVVLKQINGLPLTFSPVNKDATVRVGTDLNVKFSAATICVQSTVWKLADFDESVRKSFVSTGGVEGNPGIATVSNWFRIEKFEDRYKLVFCPGVCSNDKILCRPLCGDIGVFSDGGVRRLAVGEEPLKVYFRKA
ncbi:hypothetical protein Sjap_011663 [Stephania japonica]|uniref:Uncharacterized protein n=1 Tax=Stephania japonica TaxID=461633 RepID=A0AAP0JDK4_9MAGN